MTTVIFSGGTSVQEYESGATVPTVEYIRGSDYGGGIGGLLYSLRSGTPSFKHYNNRGDVVAATDASSSLTYQAAYEAFGRHGDTASSQEWGTNPDRQQANTKDQDPTGLLNEGFRYRDLETGTFITRDPLGFVDGPNIYTYVVQNPWTRFDPLGLAFEGTWYGATWVGKVHGFFVDVAAAPVNAAVDIHYAMERASTIRKYEAKGHAFATRARVDNFKSAAPAIAEVAMAVPGTTASGPAALPANAGVGATAVRRTEVATANRLARGSSASMGNTAGLRAATSVAVETTTGVVGDSAARIVSHATEVAATGSVATVANPKNLISRQGPLEMTMNKIKRYTSSMRQNGFDPTYPIEVANTEGGADYHEWASSCCRSCKSKYPRGSNYGDSSNSSKS